MLTKTIISGLVALLLCSGCASRQQLSVGDSLTDVQSKRAGWIMEKDSTLKLPPNMEVIRVKGSGLNHGETFLAVFEDGKLLESNWFPGSPHFPEQILPAFPKTAARLDEYKKVIWKKAAQDKIDRRKAYVDGRPHLNEQIKSAILKESVCVGMEPEDVIASWGAPKSKNISGGQFGRSEQWIYPDQRYLYFNNGKLTSWQFTQ